MIQKLIDAYELEREMYRRCIDTCTEIQKGRAKWDSGLWIRYKVFEDAITVAPKVEAEAVKHCKPVIYYHGENTFSYVCGICCMPIDNKDFYCRWCGAKIDKVEDPHKED